MAKLGFVKMHGLGNDYVVIDLINSTNRKLFKQLKDLPTFANGVCDRHFGIGADGVLLVLPPDKKGNDGKMRIINADGSEAEMCGNGIRCIAKFIIDNSYSKRRKLLIETMSGVKSVAVSPGSFTVDMGAPRLSRSEIPMNGNGSVQAVNVPLQLKYKQVRMTAVSMGNPHAVIFVDDVDVDIDELGPEIEHHPVFPKRTNVEFVSVMNNSEVELRVWERGVGETMACGTGSCASVVAAVLNEKTGRKVTVHLKGGDLKVEWAKDNHVYLAGPSAGVFSGSIDLAKFK